MWRGEVNGIFTPPHPPSPAAAPLSSSVVTAELEREAAARLHAAGRAEPLTFCSRVSTSSPRSPWGALRLQSVAGSRIRVLLQCPEDMRERE